MGGDAERPADEVCGSKVFLFSPSATTNDDDDDDDSDDDGDDDDDDHDDSYDV